MSDFLAGYRQYLSSKGSGFPDICPQFAAQGRIVAKIDQLAAKIEEARGLRYLALQEAEHLMASVRASFYGLDGRYRMATLMDISLDVTDGTHDTPGYTLDGIPFLTGKNINPTGLDFTNVQFITREDHERFRRHCPIARGDLLVTLIGTIDKVAVVDTDREFSVKNVGLIKPNPSLVHSRFVFHFLQSPQYCEQAVSYAKSTAQAFVGLKMLRKVRIPFPPLSEQRRIVAYLDDLQAKVDALKALQAQTAAELDALLPSVLDKAFKGEL